MDHSFLSPASPLPSNPSQRLWFLTTMVLYKFSYLLTYMSYSPVVTTAAFIVSFCSRIQNCLTCGTGLVWWPRKLAIKMSCQVCQFSLCTTANVFATLLLSTETVDQ